MPDSSSRSLYRILFGVIMIVLFLPGMQRWLNISSEPPLQGHVVKADSNPDFSWQNWWSGTFQQDKAAWLNENYGFRNTLLRLHNQIGYSWWNHAYTNWVIVGKENYLFDSKYINSWQGYDFVGQAVIDDKTRKLKALQHELSKRGTALLVIIAPGKASYFPEYLPDTCKPNKVNTTNYESYVKTFGREQIRTFDVRKWFNILKKQSKYALFPKCGIHWSTYGATIVQDSITGFVSALLERPLPKLEMDEIVVTDSANTIDADIGKGMNLLWEPKGYPLAYPKFHFPDAEKFKLPSCLVIGDSYYWTHDPHRFHKKVFNTIDFYYYNREHHQIGNDRKNVDTTQAWEQCKIHEVVLLYCVDANLNQLGWGFIDQAYQQMTAELTEKKSRWEWEGLSPAFRYSLTPGTNMNMRTIMGDKAWFESIKQKAADKKISADSMLYLDVEFINQERMKKR